jgi:hypothetical protein
MARQEDQAAPRTISTTKKSKRLQDLERKIAKGLLAYEEMGGALLDIKTEGLFLQTHRSWERYVIERWDLTPSRARQFMRGATVHRILVGSGTRVPLHEGQARELAPLLDNQKQLVRVANRLFADGKRPTSKDVRAEVKKHRKPAMTSKPVDEQRNRASVDANEIERLVEDIGDCVREVFTSHPDDFDAFIREVTKRLRAIPFPNVEDENWWHPFVPDLRDALLARTQEARAGDTARSRRKTASTA